MNPRLSEFLSERIESGDFPSASYLVAEKGEIVFQDALGMAVVEPEHIPATTDTIYDLASLTKPLVTGLLLAELIENKRLNPDDVIGKILTEFYTSAHAEITLTQLATHSSGLPDWRPFYLIAEQPDDVLDEIARLPPEGREDGVIYSDLNFITLAGAIERSLDAGLDEILSERVTIPLGLQYTFFNPPDSLRPRIAACEKGNLYERRTCEERFPVLDIPEAAFRTESVWGEVHDGNAYFLGGIAGHAGLFSTAEEVLKIALQFLPDRTQILRPGTCELFRSNLTTGMNEERSLAFQLASTTDSTAGAMMSPESFGHNGFTGTSLWIDPVNDRIFILLTNRTHARTLPFVNINSVRRRFHDIAIDELDLR
jgi:serine-type D-Ala-D-Ala carboxypeptidase